MKVREGGELLKAKLLIAHINNEATEMLNKSELIEANPCEGLRWNWVEPLAMKWGVVWMLGTSSTRVNPVLVCSVDYAFPNGANCWTNCAIILCSIFDWLCFRKVLKVPIMLHDGINMLYHWNEDKSFALISSLYKDVSSIAWIKNMGRYSGCGGGGGGRVYFQVLFLVLASHIIFLVQPLKVAGVGITTLKLSTIQTIASCMCYEIFKR